MEQKKTYNFGEKIRSVREKKGMTLKNVALQAGVSESLVSQIERNKVSPAIDTLLSIASVLEISLEYLFEEYTRQRLVSVIRKDERRKISEEGVVYEELSDPFTSDDQLKLETYIVTIPPGKRTHRGNYGHFGKEVGFVLEGSCRILYENKEYILEEGDSCTFSSSSPHTIENVGSEPVKAIWTVTPAQIFS